MERSFALISTLLLSVIMYGQPPTVQVWISGELTVTTSDSLTLTAVRVKGHMFRDSVRSGDHEVVFCITHAKPVAAKLNYQGKGRVVYRRPTTGKTTADRSREDMIPALGVLQADGESLFFLTEGQGFPHPPHERSVGRLSTFDVVNIVHQDARDPRGKRQNSDALSCVGANADVTSWFDVHPVVSALRRSASTTERPSRVSSAL